MWKKVRRKLPSVIPFKPTFSCARTTSRMHASSIACNSAAGRRPAAKRSRASRSRSGRRKLPTWSARNGGRGIISPSGVLKRAHHVSRRPACWQPAAGLAPQQTPHPEGEAKPRVSKDGPGAGDDSALWIVLRDAPPHGGAPQDEGGELSRIRRACSPPRGEKRSQHLGRLAFAQAPVDLWRMVTGWLAKEARSVVDSAALWIRGGVIEPAKAGQGDRARAHGAGLERHIEIAAERPP